MTASLTLILTRPYLTEKFVRRRHCAPTERRGEGANAS